ncbi:hypothetical protein LTR36_000488 [Oleoguttula mirabilis]|uniref:TauD/TfdA-like domain-containing protein n=1 Tax=Oleoguttula mirabilis TaxID=1507867 RepID=A0AAV9JPN0_9PEZI|nr:hypothetical protein LTR36_000488 [Oleoguttula mirabilis]
MSAKQCEISKVSLDGRAFDVEYGDGHRSRVPFEALSNKKASSVATHRHGLRPVTTWTADIANAAPMVSYADVQAGPGLGVLLRKIRNRGFAFVDDMPATPEATEALLASIGPIRNTHYGAFYDFTSDLSSKDTAYTSEALEPHTDNTYFTEPAGLQALHLLSHTDGSGGESSLVDGFGAANQLYREDPAAYVSLSKVGVYAHASGNDGISIQPAQPFPTFSHHPNMHYLMQVRWNTADRAGIATNFKNLERWYRAAAKFDAMLSEPKNQYWFQLKPGRMLLFDNWRVLHGRSAFTGKRRMCGGYINRDDFVSRYRMTNLTDEEIKASTITG